MFKEAILTFICFILIVKGKPNLIFLEGSEKLVSSVQIIRNGTNFTVTCVIEDLKSKTKPLDLIFWTNCDLSTKHREVHSITLCKPGSYCCISDKYKLMKRLHLIVRDEHAFVRRKRSQYHFSNQYRNAIPDLNHFRTQISPINIPNPIQDLFEGPSKKTSNNDQSIYIHDDDIFLPNSGGNAINSNNNNYHSSYGGNSVLTSYPESKHIESPPPISVSEHKDGSSNIYIYVYIIYSIAIVLAFAIIGFMIYCCVSSKRGAHVTHVPINTNVNTNNTNNQTEYCNHGFCARNRRAHTEASPAPNCYLAVLIPNDPIPLTTFQSNDNGGVTILRSLIRDDGTDGNPAARPYSDSPPAYGISSRNSPLLLGREAVLNEIDVPPPSYYQAVAKMNVDPPPRFDSSGNQTLLTSSPNVSHVRPSRNPGVHPEI